VNILSFFNPNKLIKSHLDLVQIIAGYAIKSLASVKVDLGIYFDHDFIKEDKLVIEFTNGHIIVIKAEYFRDCLSQDSDPKLCLKDMVVYQPVKI
jgi:hypothetical protein